MAYAAGGYVSGGFTTACDVSGASAGTPLDSIPRWQSLQSRCVRVHVGRITT